MDIEVMLELLELDTITSLAALLRGMGIAVTSLNYKKLNSFAKENGIDLTRVKNGRKPDSEVFKEGSTYQYSNGLRKRLIALGREYTCSTPDCEISNWMGASITLQIDHINGDSTDNRLENLRFLCPNCHQQTETWGSTPTIPQRPCETCGNRTKNPQFCSHKCYPRKGIERPATRKTKRPSEELLINELESSNWTAVGRKYGVSCNAIRKWVRFYGLDPKSIKTKRPPGGKKLEVPLDL